MLLLVFVTSGCHNIIMTCSYYNIFIENIRELVFLCLKSHLYFYLLSKSLSAACCSHLLSTSLYNLLSVRIINNKLYSIFHSLFFFPFFRFFFYLELGLVWYHGHNCHKFVTQCIMQVYHCYDLKLKVLSNRTTLVLSNTRKLDRDPFTK